MADLELFKGKISKVKKEVLTHTSGEIEKSDIKIKTSYSLTFGKSISGKGGGGKITTTHEHYTNFKIDKTSFRCAGDYNFDEGDEVMLYASETNQGFYEVLLLKNASSNFVVENYLPSTPILSGAGGIFGAGFGFIVVVKIISFIVSLIMGIDRQSTAYELWDTCVIVVGVIIGFFVGKYLYKNSKKENTIFDEAYKEIIKYNGENSA